MPRQDIIGEASAENVRRHVEHITTAIPSRLAGSPNARRMAEYSLQALREAGAEARIQELPGLVSFPKKAELRIVAPQEISIEANTLGHSVPTLPDGIVGELVDVASGTFKDYEGRDATGKITLSELSYSPARHEKQRISGLMGAIGCVMMNWGHPGNTAVPFGSVKPAWGNPTPDAFKTEMPTFSCIRAARTVVPEPAGYAEGTGPVGMAPCRMWRMCRHFGFRTHRESDCPRRVSPTDGTRCCPGVPSSSSRSRWHPSAGDALLFVPCGAVRRLRQRDLPVASRPS